MTPERWPDTACKMGRHARRRWTRAAAIGLLALAATASRADVLHLESGGKIEGRIVNRTDAEVEIDVGAGTMTLPMSSVVRIEEGRTGLDEYDARAAALAPDDLAGWLDLAQWSSRQGLGTQAQRAWQQALRIDPDNAEANRGLGRVEVDGRWMTSEEAYRAQGYVRFEGQWITAEEKLAIERQREEKAAAELAHSEARKAEADAREAEARAREADARAREAEAGDADGVYWGYWGPGPSVWPHQPPVRPGRPYPPPRPTPRPPPRPR